MPSIEMQDLSKEEETKTKTKVNKRLYQKFPFFVGNELDISKISIDIKSCLRERAVDLKAFLSSTEYKSQSIEDFSKSVKRFWSGELTLANLCCESIAETLLNNPARYKTRRFDLPKELNDTIDKKLDDAEKTIQKERSSRYFHRN